MFLSWMRKRGRISLLLGTLIWSRAKVCFGVFVALKVIFRSLISPARVNQKWDEMEMY
jgi:hypothetical protein